MLYVCVIEERHKTRAMKKVYLHNILQMCECEGLELDETHGNDCNAYVVETFISFGLTWWDNSGNFTKTEYLL